MPKLSKSLTASVAGQAAGGLATDFVYRLTNTASNHDYGYACAPDSEGNIILSYHDSTNSNRISLAKVDREGNESWKKSISVGAAQNYQVHAIAFDSNDDVYITTDYGNIYVHKFAGSDGTYQWSRRFGNTTSDATHGLIIDSNDNLFLQSYNSNYGSGGTNSSITKMGTDGSHVWTRHFDLGSANMFAYPFCLDSSGNVFMAFYGSHTTEKSGIIKISGSDGSVLEKKYFTFDTNTHTTSTPLVYPFGVAADSSDNIWVAYDYTSSGEYGAGFGLMQLDNNCDFIKAYEYQDDSNITNQGAFPDMFSMNGLRILSTGELVTHAEFATFYGLRQSDTYFVINPSNGDIARTRTAQHETTVSYAPNQFYLDEEDNVYTACSCVWQAAGVTSTGTRYKGDFTVMSLKDDVPICSHIEESMLTLLSSPSDATTLLNKYTATHSSNDSTVMGSTYDTSYGYYSYTYVESNSTMSLGFYDTKTEYNGSIEIVGGTVSSSTGGSGTITYQLPLMQQNDVVISFQVTSNNNSTPNGYTSIDSAFGDGTSSYDAYLDVAYKVMGATPDTTITWNRTNGNTYSSTAFGFLVLRGVDTSNPIDVTPTKVGQNPNWITPASITPITDGALVIAAVGQGSQYPQYQYISVNNSSTENFFYCASHFGSDNYDTALGWTVKEWKTGDGEVSFSERKHGWASLTSYGGAAISFAIRPA